ncbi:MAG: ATP-dependent zinc protease [Campylobacterales bacterium]|nr:ATP-dependent zinc protease [Campylobacterales bacterium]
MKDFYLLGWREFVALPELGIENIKCKIDTGAKTSALHAFFVDPFMEDETKMIRFGIHPIQDDIKTEIVCEAKVLDQRVVTSSNGERDLRYVIKTKIIIGSCTKDIEVTLTNRDNMRFRMLLGREAMGDDFLVAPSLSFQDCKKIELVEGKK